MSDEGSGPSNGGTGLWMAGAVIAILIAAGWFLSLQDPTRLSDIDVTNVIVRNDPVETAPKNAPEGTEDADQSMAPTADGSEAASVGGEGETVVQAPTVDEVRVEPGGTMVIAGRAAPGSSVDVLLDGEVVATVDVGADGAFAAIGSVDEDAGAQSLTLRSIEGDETIASRDEIILAPTRAIVGAETGVADALPSIGHTARRSDVGIPEEDSSLEVTPNATASIAPESSDPDPTRTVTDQSETASDVEESLGDSGQSQDRFAGFEAPETASTPEQSIPESGAEKAAAENEPEPQAEASTTGDIALLRSDDAGVTLLQPAPEPTSRLVLDTIGYNDQGIVQLSGRASAVAEEVLVYLNNRAVAQLLVSGDGAWRGAVPGVEPGVYTLRLDALAEDGSVASRLETPFKREAPDVLAAAAEETGSAGSVRAVTVQAGDTLWAIARDRYGDGVLYVRVFEANRGAIRNPDLIYPGQVFDLPGEE